jgi:hypothetical protein
VKGIVAVHRPQAQGSMCEWHNKRRRGTTKCKQAPRARCQLHAGGGVRLYRQVVWVVGRTVRVQGTVQLPCQRHRWGPEDLSDVDTKSFL